MGLFAAQALLDTFDRVTLVERNDPLRATVASESWEEVSWSCMTNLRLCDSPGLDTGLDCLMEKHID